MSDKQTGSQGMEPADGNRVMAIDSDVDVMAQAVVNATIQMHEDVEATPEARTGRIIRLRQALRNLCVASGVWTSSLECAHDADITALRKLGGIDGTAGPSLSEA